MAVDLLFRSLSSSGLPADLVFGAEGEDVTVEVQGWSASLFGQPSTYRIQPVAGWNASNFGTPMGRPTYFVTGWNAAAFGTPTLKARQGASGWNAAHFGTPAPPILQPGVRGDWKGSRFGTQRILRWAGG